MSGFPKLKLTYYPFNGRAEAIRLALHISGIPFVDERISRDQLAVLKPSLPFARLPVLEVDGVAYGESYQLLRYVGRLGGLYPPNAPFADLKIDEILQALDVIWEEMVPTLHGKSEAETQQMQEELAASTIPRFAVLFEERLQTMKKFSIFQSTDKVFIHELAIYVVAIILRGGGKFRYVPNSVLDGYALINEVIDKVAANEKVVEWYSMPHGLPKLKLKYFDFPGRGDPIRMVLKIGGIPFEDVRIPRDEFNATKASLPFQQLPVLEVDDEEPVIQSVAILRYAATLAGLYPTNDPLAALRIDELLAVIDEAYNSPVWGVIFAEQDPAKQLELHKPLVIDTFPKMVRLLDKRIGDWGGPYSTGKDFNVADVAVYVVLVYIKGGRLPFVPSTLLGPYKNLARVYDLVDAHPTIVVWNKAYPQFVA
ncbi:hypothetical protein BBJ28_00008657 [Nothophytophthora sp. Chile5]|nr:hypothetical protein BBJ28_00008657 [Nothophytophthora sp. Chile5]